MTNKRASEQAEGIIWSVNVAIKKLKNKNFIYQMMVKLCVLFVMKKHLKYHKSTSEQAEGIIWQLNIGTQAQAQLDLEIKRASVQAEEIIYTIKNIKIGKNGSISVLLIGHQADILQVLLKQLILILQNMKVKNNIYDKKYTVTLTGHNLDRIIYVFECEEEGYKSNLKHPELQNDVDQICYKGLLQETKDVLKKVKKYKKIFK